MDDLKMYQDFCFPDMGAYATTNGHNGSFVYGDASTTAVLRRYAPNQFMVRAAGGGVKEIAEPDFG